MEEHKPPTLDQSDVYATLVYNETQELSVLPHSAAIFCLNSVGICRDGGVIEPKWQALSVRNSHKRGADAW